MHSIPSSRLRAAQVDALFANVVLGVLGAAVTAPVLAVTLVRAGILDGVVGACFSTFIALCAAAHIALGRAHRRAAPPEEAWRSWAAAFTGICLAEGLGWGWASISLVGSGHPDFALLMQVATLAIAAGSIPVFGSYLPAFWAFFLPTTIPLLLFHGILAKDVQPLIVPMMTIFIATMIGVATRANHTFKEIVRLRIGTQELAAGLRVQKEAAERANRDKSHFLAAASHDLRQPVHALGLFVGALAGVTMAPEGRRLVAQIEGSVAAMDGLFGALLDISRLDAGVVEVHRRAVAIAPLLERVCRDHSGDAEAKGVGLVLHRCGAVVTTDPLLLERVVRNLVSNAVRYTGRGRVVVGCRRRGPDLAIQVWDTGRGIAFADLDRIFQEYVQLENPERDRAKGLGLGLAIVRRLSSLLDCPLDVRSRPGRGSCFGVTVPLAQDLPDVTGKDPAPMPEGLSGGLLLVVDDEQPIREAMAQLLESWGYEVIVAGSGEEAFVMLLATPRVPDLLICDYRLRAGETGIAVIERLRSEYNETVPAMLITGDTAPDRLAEAQASGLLLLHKPVPNGRLRAAIIHLMMEARAEVQDDAETVGAIP